MTTNVAPARLNATLASATGCTGGLPFSSVSSCVGVQGSGTWVTSVNGGLVLGSRDSVTGHWHITGAGININTPTKGFFNQSYWHAASYNSGWFGISRTLPKGSHVCSTFWNLIGGTRWHSEGTACVTIK